MRISASKALQVYSNNKRTLFVFSFRMDLNSRARYCNDAAPEMAASVTPPNTEPAVNSSIFGPDGGLSTPPELDNQKYKDNLSGWNAREAGAGALGSGWREQMMLSLKKRSCRWVLPVLVVITALPFLVQHGVYRWQLHQAAGADELHLFRDLYGQELWPEVEIPKSVLAKVPGVVHYVWCGSKQFRFQHYLGLLSALRVLQPAKLVFHYTHLPLLDYYWYNTWFQELKQSVPNLVLSQLSTWSACGSKDMLKEVLEILAPNGGIFLGENVILTHFPADSLRESFWFAFAEKSTDVTRGVIFASSGFGDVEKEKYLHEILSSEPACGTAQQFNDQGTSGTLACVTVTDNLYPRDIWESDTPMAEFCRWLFYGERKIRRVQKGEGERIPRITHYAWIPAETYFHRNNNFKFLHFLSVLSALYVGGFERVYVHGEAEPEGEWWEGLRRENVTFVRMDRPQTIFQQRVDAAPQHVSDIIRISVLQKYGGAYQDLDVVWVNRVPDWLLAYPAVLCPEWPEYGEWPETFNMGVMLARARAPWLRHFLKTLQYYRDDSWGFNAIRMPYKTYEWFPEEAYVDRHLQVICFHGWCHPTWHPDYKRSIDDDTRPTGAFKFDEVRAFHFTEPKPVSSLASVQNIRDGTDRFSQFGRNLLKRSGREAWLKT